MEDGIHAERDTHAMYTPIQTGYIRRPFQGKDVLEEVRHDRGLDDWVRQGYTNPDCRQNVHLLEHTQERAQQLRSTEYMGSVGAISSPVRQGMQASQIQTNLDPRNPG